MLVMLYTLEIDRSGDVTRWVARLLWEYDMLGHCISFQYDEVQGLCPTLNREVMKCVTTGAVMF